MGNIAMLLGGGVLLYFGAAWLVGGAAGLARALGVPQLLVGLTVVAYGTSAPEVVVGIEAAAGGHGDIALGNVVGSNIANIGLILGLTALLKPARVDGALVRREVPVLLVTALLVPLALVDGVVGKVDGAVLVTLAVGYSVWMVRSARGAAAVAEAQRAAAATEAAADDAGAPAPASKVRMGVTAAFGLAVLVVGGSLFVEGASGLARVLGMSERLVGLTIVAVGTSLPELATSLLAAWRGHADIAVGNVVGSNIFNVLLCLGTAGLVGDLATPIGRVALDLGVMVAMTVTAAVMMRTERHISRAEGAALLVAYAAFVTVLATTPVE